MKTIKNYDLEETKGNEIAISRGRYDELMQAEWLLSLVKRAVEEKESYTLQESLSFILGVKPDKGDE